MTMPDPVGVSGPGPLSQRTDRQPLRAPTGLPYGDNQALLDTERGAPLAQAAAPQITPLTAASQRPAEPVTHGADAGPGASSAILTATPGAPATGGAVSQAIAKAAATDTSGLLAQLLVAAQQRGL
jgi:hypothetical protein